MTLVSSPALSNRTQDLRIRPSSSSDNSRSSEEHLQDVFTAVLAEVGRKGYESNRVEPPQAVTDTDLKSSWEEWFDSVVSTRYSFRFGFDNPSVRKGKSSEDLKTDYGQILSSAYHDGGYVDPRAFLTSLNEDQLATVQQVHHLAEPISPADLTEEASLNLLIPPAAQVDSNRDGLTAVGAAWSFRFPDSNTPQDVRDAWNVAIQGLSESERMFYSLQMSFPLITSNLHSDDQGRFVRASQPGDRDWRNPITETDFDYAEHAAQWLTYLDDFKSQLAPGQYERDQRFWSTFRQHLLD